MSTKKASAFTSSQLEAKIIRADGTVEDLGVIAYWHRNPLKRLMFKLESTLRRITARAAK